MGDPTRAIEVLDAWRTRRPGDAPRVEALIAELGGAEAR
jgi:hypothetical protein